MLTQGKVQKRSWLIKLLGFFKYKFWKLYFSESRPRGCRHHHHVRAGAGRGLHHALHEPRGHHPVQEAQQEGPQPVLLPLPPLHRRVDLHHHRLPGSLAAPIHTLKVCTGLAER